MDVSVTTSEAFDAAKLEIQDCGKKGRGIFAKEHFKCGHVLLREEGFHAKDMEMLATLVLASEKGRCAAAGMYAGSLHHLQMSSMRDGSELDGTNSPEWLDMYAKVRYNCFQLDGSALLPNMALFNHDCWPNAALVRLEPFTDCIVAMVVIAKDGIAAGQEVVQCYDSDLIFEPVHIRRRQLMSTWSFMCTCDRCETDEANENQTKDEAAEEITDEDFANMSPCCLSNARMYFGRQDVMHKPALPFKLRRQMFSAQLAANCSLLPHLHPKLRDVYLHLEDLCEPSTYRDHGEYVCKFYAELCKDKGCKSG